MNSRFECNKKTRFYFTNDDEMEVYLPWYENILNINYLGISQLWLQLWSGNYTYNNQDYELIATLKEIGVIIEKEY